MNTDKNEDLFARASSVSIGGIRGQTRARDLSASSSPERDEADHQCTRRSIGLGVVDVDFRQQPARKVRYGARDRRRGRAVAYCRTALPLPPVARPVACMAASGTAGLFGRGNVSQPSLQVEVPQLQLPAVSANPFRM